MTIWKYVLGITDHQKVALPKGAQVLSCGIQRDVLCIWVLVDPDVQLEDRGFYIHGTGHFVNPELIGEFVGTFFLAEGSLVFHLFEEAA